MHSVQGQCRRAVAILTRSHLGGLRHLGPCRPEQNQVAASIIQACKKCQSAFRLAAARRTRCHELEGPAVLPRDGMDDGQEIAAMRRRPHHGLFLFQQLIPSHLWQKHQAVCLIEDNHVNPAESRGPNWPSVCVPEEVHESPRGADHDAGDLIRAAILDDRDLLCQLRPDQCSSKGAELHHEGLARSDDDHPQVRLALQFVFPGRDVHQPLNQRQHEGQRLARARGGVDHDVLPLQNRFHAECLDVCRLHGAAAQSGHVAEEGGAVAGQLNAGEGRHIPIVGIAPIRLERVVRTNVVNFVFLLSQAGTLLHQRPIVSSLVGLPLWSFFYLTWFPPLVQLFLPLGLLGVEAPPLVFLLVALAPTVLLSVGAGAALPGRRGPVASRASLSSSSWSVLQASSISLPCLSRTSASAFSPHRGSSCSSGSSSSNQRRGPR
mmetsp:Transcript_1008/g.4113  ORF Transcript_1008/g.4113 Transcript_1008/m.4113 type:complete len:435 (+) Transcript_1008:994-2298(+)